MNSEKPQLPASIRRVMSLDELEELDLIGGVPRDGFEFPPARGHRTIAARGNLDIDMRPVSRFAHDIRAEKINALISHPNRASSDDTSHALYGIPLGCTLGLRPSRCGDSH